MTKKDSKQKKVQITNCETCAFYTYDEEYGYYVCEADLDEDEMERFLRAGIPLGDALGAVSPALRLRSDGMRFTTLDAFTLDLFSGRAENLKCGAAPTYMRLNGRWTILPGTALPIGLAEEDELGDAVPLQMNDGDIVVMLSDGVTDGTDDKWVRQLLIAHAGDSPKEIAAQLVNEAKGRGHDDDRTVMVMKIEKLE